MGTCVFCSMYQITEWGDEIKVQSMIAYLFIKLTKTLQKHQLSLFCTETHSELYTEDEENSDEEEELDKQMGNLDNAEADDKLDERLWGDEEDDDDDEEDASSKTEETGPGMDEVIKKGVGGKSIRGIELC